MNFAVAGKGGSGKTSVASLIIRYLKKKGLVPVLAVDADGNANLGDSLGLNVDKTIGSILADFNEKKIDIPSGLTKGAYLYISPSWKFKLSVEFSISMGTDVSMYVASAESFRYPVPMLRYLQVVGFKHTGTARKQRDGCRQTMVILGNTINSPLTSPFALTRSVRGG